MQSVPKYTPTLVLPSTEWYPAWLEAMTEFRLPFTNIAGASVSADDDVTDVAGFAVWLNKMEILRDPQQTNPGHFVDHTQFWVVDELHRTVLGFVSLRHELNDYLRAEGGHIGYGIRPSARRQGLATWALNATMAEAQKLGLEKLLVTCDQSNEGSRRTIEKCGGTLENIIVSPERGLVRRHWITL